MAGTRDGFELIDIGTLFTQALLDPGAPTPFPPDLRSAKCLAVHVAGRDFLVCYDSSYTSFTV